MIIERERNMRGNITEKKGSGLCKQGKYILRETIYISSVYILLLLIPFLASERMELLFYDRQKRERKQTKEEKFFLEKVEILLNVIERKKGGKRKVKKCAGAKIVFEQRRKMKEERD